MIWHLNLLRKERDVSVVRAEERKETLMDIMPMEAKKVC